MEELQKEFEELVKENLKLYNEENDYINIDVFEIWNYIKDDVEFKNYAKKSKIKSLNNVIYQFTVYDINLVTDIKRDGILIISNYLDGIHIPTYNLERYVNFVTIILILINYYVNYNLKNKKNIDFINEVLDNYQNSSCLINLQINKMIYE